MTARKAKNGNSMITTASAGSGTSNRRSRGAFAPNQSRSAPATATGIASWRIQPWPGAVPCDDWRSSLNSVIASTARAATSTTPIRKTLVSTRKSPTVGPHMSWPQ